MKFFAYFAVIALSSASLINLFKRATANGCEVESCYKAHQTLINSCNGAFDFNCLCNLPQSYFQNLYDCSKSCDTLQESDIHSLIYCEAASNSIYTFSIDSISLDMIGYSDFETDTEATTGSDTRTKAATGATTSAGTGVTKTLETGGVSSTANSEAKLGSVTTSKSGSTSISESKTTSGSSSSGKSSSSTSSASSQQTSSHAGGASGAFVSLLGLFAALLI